MQYFGIITDHRIEPQYDLIEAKVRFNIRGRIMRSGSGNGEGPLANRKKKARNNEGSGKAIERCDGRGSHHGREVDAQDCSRPGSGAEAQRLSSQPQHGRALGPSVGIHATQQSQASQPRPRSKA